MSTCRFCKKYGNDLLKYGTRHYAHYECYFDNVAYPLDGYFVMLHRDGTITIKDSTTNLLLSQRAAIALKALLDRQSPMSAR